KPHWILFVEMDGDPVAGVLQMPDLNEATADLNGRLLPLGWLKLLWRMRRPTVRNSRLLLLGVRRHLHRTGLAPMAGLLVLEEHLRTAKRHGIGTAELGWVVESNQPVMSFLQRVTPIQRKVYRVYQKSL